MEMKVGEKLVKPVARGTRSSFGRPEPIHGTDVVKD